MLRTENLSRSLDLTRLESAPSSAFQKFPVHNISYQDFSSAVAGLGCVDAGYFALGRSEAAQTLGGLWPFISLLMACVLAVLYVLGFFKHKPKRDSVIVFGLGVVFLLLGVSLVGNWGTWLHLQLCRQQYEAFVQHLAQTSSDAERKAICENRCWFRTGDTLQVSFYYHRYVFLFWSELIYDPAGEISHPRQQIGLRTNLPLHTVHLSGSW